MIAGKYRVERLLGEGGMGVVLAARHLGLDEMVAVKLIREERAAGSDALARFQREARAAARIKSEHVARVLDVDTLPEGDPYIVMEFIDGTDLHALVNRRGKLPPDEAASFTVQACEGLAEAHALGMVHRDLKLKNLFLSKRRDGRQLIKVIDFGVVKFSRIGDDEDPTLGSSRLMDELGRIRARDATLTGASVLVGSVHYMAPEQIRASNVVDARADVWSLGVCLYEMLTGELPFDGNTVAEVCAKIQGAPPIDVRAHADYLPPNLAAVVIRALEKDVRRRFQSVAELSAALAPFHADRAAVSRIETILESSVKRIGSAPTERSAPETQIGHPDLGHAATIAMTQDMVSAPFSAPLLSPRPPMPHMEPTTIDAATTGSLAPRPPARRSRLLPGALVMLAAAGITVALWLQRPHPAPIPAPAAQQTMPPPIQTAPAPTTPEPVIPAATPTITSSAPIASEPPPPASATPKAHRGRPPKPAAAAPKNDPAAKPEPTATGAYDHF